MTLGDRERGFIPPAGVAGLKPALYILMTLVVAIHLFGVAWGLSNIEDNREIATQARNQSRENERLLRDLNRHLMKLEERQAGSLEIVRKAEREIDCRTRRALAGLPPLPKEQLCEP